MRLLFAMPAASRFPTLLALLLAATTSSAAFAAPPSPLNPELWAFPGAGTAPGSAMSAGFALSDRWLGAQPFDNPASLPVRGVVASGVLQRMSRQDLRADNRQYDEQGAFIDFGGGWLCLPVGGFGIVVYAHQPVLRLEDNAFTRGQPGGPVQPAVVASNASSREQRAGLALSQSWGELRVGVAGEFTRRDDVYEVKEESGSPDEGLRHLDFSGTGFGAQVGLRFREDRAERGVFAFGVGARFVPALTLEGEQIFTLLSGDSLAVVSAERESGIEAGASASYRITQGFRLLAGAGGRGAREWTGFDVRSGAGYQWSVGGEFHDDRDPWTVRFGLGQEHEDDVPEPDAGILGLGIGWSFDSSRIDFGVLHRTLKREGSPNSFDDRVVATVTATF